MVGPLAWSTVGLGTSEAGAEAGSGGTALATGAAAAVGAAGVFTAAGSAGAAEVGFGVGASPPSITYEIARSPNTSATMGNTTDWESGRVIILSAKLEPLGNPTVNVDPSSACARAFCSSAPRDGWAVTTRLTTSDHLRWSSPASASAEVPDAGVGAAGGTGTAEAPSPSCIGISF